MPPSLLAKLAQRLVREMPYGSGVFMQTDDNLGLSQCIHYDLSRSMTAVWLGEQSSQQGQETFETGQIEIFGARGGTEALA